MFFIIFFFFHSCQCKATELCLKDHDDVSTYTFQYRCHKNKTAGNEVAPEKDFVPDGAVGYGNN